MGTVEVWYAVEELGGWLPKHPTAVDNEQQLNGAVEENMREEKVEEEEPNEEKMEEIRRRREEAEERFKKERDELVRKRREEMKGNTAERERDFFKSLVL